MRITDTVAIVVDENYQGLPDLASRMAVWVIDNPANRRIIEKLWKERENPGNDLTLFKAALEIPKESQLLSQVSTIELHFPDANCLLLVGVSAVSALRDRFLELGYVLEKSGDDLLARKSGELSS